VEIIELDEEVNAFVADHNSTVRPAWVIMSPAKKKSKNIESQGKI